MPEIAEGKSVARIVYYLRHHLVGKTIKKANAVDDNNVFGKVGTTGAAVAAALTGKKVLSAGSQGKYFWLILDKPPHPVMHFGMTGWIHIRGEQTAYTNYYKRMSDEDKAAWPPKYWKFHLITEDPAVEVAFTDPRRFGRVRLVDCPGDSIRKFSPLVENGPDPVVDPEVFTEEYLRDKMRSRHVPIKALLLDQTVISGIGNWVADETLYHARLHPEQYCDDFNDEQIKQLYESIRYVCQFAVDKLGDSDQFPADWLFHYRWGKGSKGAVGHLPSGEKLAWLTVGGRTSCYVPERQKKSGRVVPGVKEELVDSGKEEKPKGGRAKKVKEEPVEGAEEPKSKGPGRGRKVKEEPTKDEGETLQAKKVVLVKTVKAETEKPRGRRRKAEDETSTTETSASMRTRTAKKTKREEVAVEAKADGRRRSSRLRTKTTSDYFESS